MRLHRLKAPLGAIKQVRRGVLPDDRGKGEGSLEIPLDPLKSYLSSRFSHFTLLKCIGNTEVKVVVRPQCSL
jgi:hypothetical protein